MSLTFGFYNSRNHDRRYNAIQISSIFDGIIRDGIYMSIGDHMVVKQNTGLMVTVGTGRAWFNHTWTLNDALFPIEIPLSEVILNRIDAVVLEVNGDRQIRANSIKVVKGTPATNPSRPAMVNTDTVHQYPLAYIYVGAGVTEIRQSNITNMVGTSSTPFVTGIIDTINIDDLIAQWGDQWQEFYEKQVTDMERTNVFWKEQWSSWFQTHTKEIQDAYLMWEQEWIEWFNSIQDMLGSVDNGEMLAELLKLVKDLYRMATDEDIDQIIGNIYVDTDDDHGSIFEVGSKQDIDDIINGNFVDDEHVMISDGLGNL